MAQNVANFWSTFVKKYWSTRPFKNSQIWSRCLEPNERKMSRPLTTHEFVFVEKTSSKQIPFDNFDKTLKIVPSECEKNFENGRFLGGFERYLHVTYTKIFQITFYYKDFSFTDPQSMFKSHFKQVWWKVNKPPFGCSTSPSNNVDTIKSLLSTVVTGRERTLTVGGSIAVRLVSSLTGL